MIPVDEVLLLTNSILFVQENFIQEIYTTNKCIGTLKIYHLHDLLFDVR